MYDALSLSIILICCVINKTGELMQKKQVNLKDPLIHLIICLVILSAYL